MVDIESATNKSKTTRKYTKNKNTTKKQNKDNINSTTDAEQQNKILQIKRERKPTPTKRKPPVILQTLPQLPPFPQFLLDNKNFQICPLAETCEKLILKREYFLEPKLDGVRVITFVKDGRYRMFSRSAKEYKFFNSKFIDEIYQISFCGILFYFNTFIRMGILIF